MKLVRTGDKRREIEVPATWEEAENMLTHALGPYYDERGRNSMKLSIAARVAHGMFAERYMSPDPTTTLLYLLKRICTREGADLG